MVSGKEVADFIIRGKIKCYSIFIPFSFSRNLGTNPINALWPKLRRRNSGFGCCRLRGGDHSGFQNLRQGKVRFRPKAIYSNVGIGSNIHHVGISTSSKTRDKFGV